MNDRASGVRNLLLGAALGAALLVGGINPVNAGPPHEVTANETINFVVGQTRTFMFDQPVNEFKIVTDGIVKITPLSDRTFAIRALQSGDAFAVAYNGDHVVQRVNFHVAPGASHMVKIYGNSSGGKNQNGPSDYIGFVCDNTSCGRADPDIGPTPSEVDVSRTRNEKNGSSTITQIYR